MIHADSLSGLVGPKDKDISYEQVIDHYGLDLELQKLNRAQYNQDKSEIAASVLCNRSPMFKVRHEPLPLSAKTGIILKCLYLGKSAKSEAEERNLQVEQVNNVIYEFREIMKASKRARKRVNMKRNRLTKAHLNALMLFANEHMEKGFTLMEAQSHLETKFAELQHISLSTLSLCLRKKLKFSYKKLGVSNPVKITVDHRCKLTLCWKILIGFLERDFLLIFVDEFLVNRNTMNSYGWAKQGMPGRLVIKPWDFRMSFIVAHSYEDVEGIMGTKTTFNQEKYLKFIKQLVVRTKSKYKIDSDRIVIVADNCKFHRTQKVEDYFKDQKLKWLFIPAYSPEINPCEKLINFIKSFVKKQVSTQRYGTNEYMI